MRSNRAFLARTVRFLAGEAGIRQFLDIGTGIPAANNTRDQVSRFTPQRQTYRSHTEVSRFFHGMDFVEPGLVRVQDWRPDSEMEANRPSALWGGVARKRPAP